MLAGRFEDEPGFGAEGAGAEEEDHDEGVGEAHFCAVDDAIADAFDEGEDLVVLGVEDDALERFLEVEVLVVGGTVLAGESLPRARGVCPLSGGMYVVRRGAS